MSRRSSVAAGTQGRSRRHPRTATPRGWPRPGRPPRSGRWPGHRLARRWTIACAPAVSRSRSWSTRRAPPPGRWRLCGSRTLSTISSRLVLGRAGSPRRRVARAGVWSTARRIRGRGRARQSLIPIGCGVGCRAPWAKRPDRPGQAARRAWERPRAATVSAMSDRGTQRATAGVIDAFDAATRAIAELQSVDDVLQVIVDQVRPLVGARYAALGIVDADGVIERFITVGHQPRDPSRGSARCRAATACSASSSARTDRSGSRTSRSIRGATASRRTTRRCTASSACRSRCRAGRSATCT